MATTHIKLTELLGAPSESPIHDLLFKQLTEGKLGDFKHMKLRAESFDDVIKMREEISERRDWSMLCLNIQCYLTGDVECSFWTDASEEELESFIFVKTVGSCRKL